MTVPRLSIVVPAHRCADTIANDIAKIETTIRTLEPCYEIVVVVDGEEGGMRDAALPLRSDHVTVWYEATNRGKGHAVVTGLLRARGTLVGFMDAGSDIDMSVWGNLLHALQSYQADIAIASKVQHGSRVSYPPIRRAYSMAFRLLVGVLFRLNVEDTQTGAKLFRSEVVERVAPCLLVKRFAFDVEFLALARRWGFDRMVEVPVQINYQFRSTVNARAVFQTLWDTAAIWYRIHLRGYYDHLDNNAERLRRLAASHAVRL